MSACFDFNSTYTDLVAEIDILDTRIKDMERERDFLRKNMYINAPSFNGVVDYSTERVTGGIVPLALDRIIDRMNKIDYTIEIMNEQLKAKKDARQRIEKMIEQLDGLEYKVAYMRDVLNMKLYEIADKLGYSHDHIRRISSRIKKMPQRCHKMVVNS